jgi:hypothetical protein
VANPGLWEKAFPITFVTRADLVRAGCRRGVARALTDDQMKAIATKMSEYYVHHEFGGFWEDLKAATEYVLNQPPQPIPPEQAQPRQELL